VTRGLTLEVKITGRVEYSTLVHSIRDGQVCWCAGNHM